MFDDPTTVGAGAGLAGFVLGYGIRSYIAIRNAPNKGRQFGPKQIERWHINDEWANILLRKDKSSYAEQQLDKLNESKDRAEHKRKELFSERDKALEDLNDIRQQVKVAESDFEGNAILQGIGTVAADLSSIRRRFDHISNDFVTYHQNVVFIESVLRNDSMNQIIKRMDQYDLQGVIKNNEGLALDMTESEIKAMGSAKTLSEVKAILKI